MGPVVYYPAVTGPRIGAQRGVERQRLARVASRERQGQVGLVDVARADRFLQRGKRFLVGALRQGRLHRPDARRAGAEPVRHRVRGDTLRPIERAEPHQRARSARQAIGQGRQPRLQRKARFVSDIARQVRARLPRRFRLCQHAIHIGRAPRHEDAGRRAVQLRIRRACCARIVEKDERLHARQP